MKSNWTGRNKLLASDYKTVWKNSPILSKALLIFFKGKYGNILISKELLLKEPLDDVMLHPLNYSDIEMALRADHFVD